MRRPLFWFGIFFVLCCALALRFSETVCLLALPAAAAVSLFLPERQARGRMMLLALLGCVCALWASASWGAAVEAREADVGRSVEFTGYVAEVSERGDGYCTVRFWLDGRLRAMRGAIEADGALRPGDWLSGTALLTAARENTDDFLFTGGVLYSARFEETRSAAAPEKPDLLCRGTALRARLADELWKLRRDDASALLAGVVFSDRERLSREAGTSLRTAGVSHIVSVSGLHLSVAVGLALALCRRLKAGRASTLLAGLAMAALMLFAGGFSVSVTRAAAMSALALAAWALGRRADGLTSLMLAGAALCAVCPALTLDASFLLSFSGAFGILLFAGPISEGLTGLWQARLGEPKKISAAAISSASAVLAAQIGVAPAAAGCFGFLPAYGVFLNLIVFPLVQLMLLLGGLASVLLAMGARGAGRLVGQAACLPARAVLALGRGISALPYAALRLPFFWQAALVGLAVGCAAAFVALRGRERARRVFLACCAALLTLSVCAGVYTDGCVVVASDRSTGAAVATLRGQSVLFASGESGYDRRAEAELLLRCGGTLRAAVCPASAPADDAIRLAAALRPQTLYLPAQDAMLAAVSLPESCEVLPLDALPSQLLPGVTVSLPAPEIACAQAGGGKLLKLWAGYGIIKESDIPADCSLLVDLAGEMYSPDGRVRIDRTREDYRAANAGR